MPRLSARAEMMLGASARARAVIRRDRRVARAAAAAAAAAVAAVPPPSPPRRTIRPSRRNWRDFMRTPKNYYFPYRDLSAQTIQAAFRGHRFRRSTANWLTRPPSVRRRVIEMRRNMYVHRDAAARRIQNIYRQRNARRAQVARRRRFPFPSSSSSAHMDESVDDLVHDDDVKGSMIGGGTMPNVATFRDPHDHLSGGGGVVHNNFNPHDAGNFLDEDAEAGYKRSRHEAELATGQREHINNFPRIENAGEELDETTQHFEDI